MSKCSICIKRDVCGYRPTFETFENTILDFSFTEDHGELGVIIALRGEVAENHIDIDLRCKHFVTEGLEQNRAATLAYETAKWSLEKS